ncbi:MAG TPA: GNAT family N-acetyltransferase [Dehalococcoidia bacterium]|jgi:ribosomal protein S18 acetylase RimI-like enzyme|nr:GNAT family N-acetyltransferase [Dehalococcoidia bacterium]
MHLTIRPATDTDLPALTRLDLTYPTDRILTIARSGDPPEHTFTLRWRNRVPDPMAVYATYTVDGLREALVRTDFFLLTEVDGEIAGLLMIIVPEWTDAAEITDLAVDIAFRRMGAGRALVDAAVEWTRERGHRSLWVEPRADNHAAISFYLSLGFRISGFNDRLYSNADHEDGKPTVYMHLELL